MSKLFEKAKLESLELNNRVVMAPMTRARTTQPGNIPNQMMADYYKQRASAGLIITEATQISDDSQGYSFTPGVYTDARWKAGKLSLVRQRRKALLSFVSYGM
ncbi:N-ethylmaleimide reductase [Vibrio sp. JCM 19236]|nr:N-ethylmaleimide reductase [Vibrio sp. JCM 19236]